MALLTPDICVIGASAAGAALAMGAAAFGVSVVLVDNGEFAAGAPVDRQAVLAALAATAARVHAVRASMQLGLGTAEPSVDFRAVARHLARISTAASRASAPERIAAAGVHVLRSGARFRDPRTLMAGETEIRARRFVIAVGSSPVRPEVSGLDAIELLDLRALPTLTRRPGHLLVLGGASEAVAAAQAVRRLGSEVTLVAAEPILPGFDAELVALLRSRLGAEGIALLENASVAGVERRGKAGLRAHLQAGARLGSVDATHLLLAAGDVPDIAGLDLPAAGIGFDGKAVIADARLRTANRRVFVLGAAAGAPCSLSRAAQQVGVLIRALLFRRSASEDAAVVPRLVLADPELAEVGVSEDAGRAGAGRIRILRWPFAENLRARAEGRPEGHIKVVADARGRILGASILGAGAGEAIGAWSLALTRGMSLEDMAGWSPAAPSFGEIGKSVAVPYLAEAARRPSVRRLIRFLRLLG